MGHLVVLGAWDEAPSALAALVQDGYCLTVARDERLLAQLPDQGQAALLIATLSEAISIPALAAAARRLAVPWLALSLGGAATLTSAAYQAGALAVLPSDAEPAALRQAVHTALSAVVVQPVEPWPRSGRRRIGRGETLQLAEDAVIEVESGIIALSVIHRDGAEVLLGLLGPGQVLSGHPDDGCELRLVGHTDVQAVVVSWQEALHDRLFPPKLRARLRQMEAWAAMQARPYLDQRILGILSLLGEQFGRPDDEGLLVDVHITHGQLASAVGATRATVTRMLGELRARGLLTSVGPRGAERYCLREWERSAHAVV